MDSLGGKFPRLVFDVPYGCLFKINKKKKQCLGLFQVDKLVMCLINKRKFIYKCDVPSEAFISFKVKKSEFGK